MNGIVRRLPVKGANGAIDLIEPDAIYYLEAQGDDTLIRTKRKKPYKSVQRLGDLAKKLPAPAFVRCIASFVAPGGTLLVIARGRELGDCEGKMPWLLTKDELSLFKTGGLKEVSFEDYMDNENPPVRRFRATYRLE
jgi:hypothetical protein